MPNFSPGQQSEPPIPVTEAQSRVLAAAVPFGTEDVPVTDADGRVLREDVVAQWDVPGADNSAMDGYAVRGADLSGANRESPVRLRVVDDVPAGAISVASLAAGEAARIMTGALIPDGADTVVQVEITDAGRDEVSVFRDLTVGTNVRRRGDDISMGDVVLRSGTLIRSGEVGVLATVGRSSVEVARRPVVAILSTGSEIVDLGEKPPPGKVTNSNAYALAALVRESGGVPRVMGVVPDTRDVTVEAISAALHCDIVLTSGGVSVGAYDFVREAVRELGAETRFWRVAMKPGKPILFAVRGESLIFGLPGNPVSSMVGFHLFVGPAIRKGLGLDRGILPVVVSARAASPMRSKGDRLTYLRTRVVSDSGKLVAYPMKVQGSGVTTSMIGANGLAVVPEGTNLIEEGHEIEVVMIGPIESP